MFSFRFFFAVLILTGLVAACGQTEPQIIVVTATPLPPTPTERVSVVTATSAAPTPTPYVMFVTVTPQPTYRPNGALVLHDDFNATSGARALFSPQYMIFNASEETGNLTGLGANIVLPAVYDSPKLRNFNAEFDLLIESLTNDARYGLIFHSDQAPGELPSYDFITIVPGTNEARYEVWQNKAWSHRENYTLPAGLVKPVEATHIRIESFGQDVRLFVNDRLIFQTTLVTRNAGIFALTIATGKEVPATVHLDNLHVYSTETSNEVTVATPAPTPTPTRKPSTATPTVRVIPPTSTSPALASYGCPRAQGNLLFYDDFANPRSGWTEYTGKDYDHFYKDGEWHLRVTKANWTGTSWILLANTRPAYQLEVRATRLEGPEMNHYGLVFGGVNDINYDAYHLSDAGSYRLNKIRDGNSTDLAAWTKTSSIRKSGWNYLGVIVRGTQITACVNGQVLTTLNDPSLKVGRVGMFAGSYDEPVHIHFDDLGVWNLE